jgi:type I restriction enzyme S subunit
MKPQLDITQKEYLSKRSFSVNAKWLLQGEYRFDATAYSEGAIRALDLIDRVPGIKTPLGECVKSIYHPTENQARSNFKRIWVNKENGVPFLNGRQLFHFRPLTEKYISKGLPKIDELRVSPGTILLTRSGTLGIPLLANQRLTSFAITDDILRIIPGKIPIGYVYAFLASRYGYALMTKSSYGSTVSHLEAKHLSSLPLPIIDVKTQEILHNMIMESYTLLDKANEMIDEAEISFYSMLGLEPFDSKDIEYIGDNEGSPKAFSILASELGGRFDAAHHVPLARSAINKLGRGLFPLVTLKNIASKVYLAPRFARIYVESDYGTPLLQGSHVPLTRIRDLKYISNSQTNKIERWLINKGTVLVTCSGTIGKIGIATDRMDKWAASQHILRIEANYSISHEGFMALFLMSEYGQHQLKSKIYGGVVDELTAEDTEGILIPMVPYKIQKQLGDLVRDAFEMRDKAVEIEKRAISIMEAIIEGNVN